MGFKFGHCLGGSGLAQMFGVLFFIERELFDFFYRVLNGYYRFIRYSMNKHIIDIWNFNTHLGEKCSSGAHISCPNSGNAQI